MYVVGGYPTPAHRYPEAPTTHRGFCYPGIITLSPMASFLVIASPPCQGTNIFPPNLFPRPLRKFPTWRHGGIGNPWLWRWNAVNHSPRDGCRRRFFRGKLWRRLFWFFSVFGYYHSQLLLRPAVLLLSRPSLSWISSALGRSNPRRCSSCRSTRRIWSRGSLRSDAAHCAKASASTGSKTTCSLTIRYLQNNEKGLR